MRFRLSNGANVQCYRSAKRVPSKERQVQPGEEYILWFAFEHERPVTVHLAIRLVPQGSVGKALNAADVARELGFPPRKAQPSKQAAVDDIIPAPKLAAGFTKPHPDGTAQLFIVATMASGVHTYSITQLPGGPSRTTIKVDDSAKMSLIGKFQAVGKPEVKHFDFWPGVPVEQHAGTVKWVAPIRLAPGVKPETVKIEGKVNMQLENAMGGRMPTDFTFTAAFRPGTPEVRMETVPGQSRRE